MQAALSIAPPLLPTVPHSKNLPVTSSPRPAISIASRRLSIKATAPTNDTSTVDYSSTFSVFPAEACETIGGDACMADMYPEAKLKATEATNNPPKTAEELIDREYVDYNDGKTVFCAEACDDLGGEFCSQEYQKGVY